MSKFLLYSSVDEQSHPFSLRFHSCCFRGFSWRGEGGIFYKTGLIAILGQHCQLNFKSRMPVMPYETADKLYQSQSSEYFLSNQ